MQTLKLSAVFCVVVLSAGNLLAQAPPSTAAATQPASTAANKDAPAGTQPKPELKMSPDKILKQFEPAENEEYQLGAGDEITLEFPTRPELSGKHVIGPDGRITLSLVGPISVANKTRDDAAKAITTALAPYYTNAPVTIRIDKYGSNRILIMGNVTHPGVLYFDQTPTLLDAIARGGLPSDPARKDGIPERCAIYRGNDQVVWVDLRNLLQAGNPMADMRLRRNDIVFVPAQKEVFVSVMGAVGHPGAVNLTSESTVSSVVAQAGGLAEGAASKVQIISPSTGKTQTVAFDYLLTPKGATETTLHAGDIIYVPRSGFYKTTYVLSRLSPAASIAMMGALVAVQ